MHASGAAFRAWRSFRGAGVHTRAFLAARLLVLPLGALAEELRQVNGRVLSVGAGHGLLERFAAELNPGVTVTGLDLDAERAAVADATRRNAPRVEIRAQDVRSLDEDGGYDAAIAIDLLHHVPTEDHAALAAALARAVKPGGTLLVKDIARTPNWKNAVNRLHDRIVASEATTGLEPEALAELFAEAGFRTERLERIAPLSPYPHFILRARRVPESP